MFSRARFFLRESLRGFLYHKFMTFAVVVNMGISLFLVGTFLVAFLNLDRLISQAEDRISLEVFLEDGAADVHVLKNEIENTAGVRKAEYVSKEEAYRIFSEEVDGEILRSVEGNPLPASFKVQIRKTFRTPDRLKEIREQLLKIPFVEEVTGIRAWVPMLEKTRNIFVGVSFAAVLVLSLAIFFTVSSTIRVTYLARQDLFKTLQLLGASETSIRIPFLMEGALKGFCGGLFSVLILFGALVSVRRMFPEIVPFPQVYAIQMGLALLLGLVASLRTGSPR